MVNFALVIARTRSVSLAHAIVALCHTTTSINAAVCATLATSWISSQIAACTVPRSPSWSHASAYEHTTKQMYPLKIERAQRTRVRASIRRGANRSIERALAGACRTPPTTRDLPQPAQHGIVRQKVERLAVHPHHV